MKKYFKYSMVVIVTLFLCTSCKEQIVTTTTETPTIVGLWLGKQSDDAKTYPTYGVAALFRANGTVRYFASQDTTLLDPTNEDEIAEGTYTLSGSSLTAKKSIVIGGKSYDYVVTAEVNNRITFIEGNWIFSVANKGGKWFMYKK